MQSTDTTRKITHGSQLKEGASLDRLIKQLPLLKQHEYRKKVYDDLDFLLHYPLPENIGSVEDIQQQAYEELQRLGIFKRAAIRFSSIFNSTTLSSVYIKKRLHIISRKIGRKKRLFNMQNAYLTHSFLLLFSQLYEKLYPIINMYRRCWNDVDILRFVINSITKKHLPQTMYGLQTHISIETFIDVIERNNGPSDIFAILQDEVAGKLNEITEDVWQEIEEELFPLYALRYLCFFDYEKFKKLFAPQTKSLFKNEGTSFLQSRTLVFQFFFAISQLLRLGEVKSLSKTLLESLAMLENNSQEILSVGKSITDAFRFAQENFNFEQMQNLLRCSYYDPYYHLHFDQQSWNIKGYISHEIFLHLWSQVATSITHFNTQIFRKKVQELFPNGLMNFKYVTAEPCKQTMFPMKKHIIHIPELQFLATFFSNVRVAFPWLDSLQLAHPSLVNMPLLNTLTEMCKTMREEYANFDHMFAETADVGKQFCEISRDFYTKKTHHEAIIQYDELVARINESGQELITRGIEVLKMLTSFFKQLRENMTQKQYKTLASDELSIQERDNENCNKYYSMVVSMQEIVTQFIVNKHYKHNIEKSNP